MRRKYFVPAAVAALAILLIFSGCGGDDPAAASGTPPPPADYVEYSGEWQETDEPLTVCISSQLGGRFPEQTEELLEYLSGVDAAIEWIVIPAEAENSDALLTQIHTEIMAGGGPDVFIAEAPIAQYVSYEDISNLFPMPEKTLNVGVFLPLDGLLENPRYMDTDGLQSTVLEVGQVNHQQMILPLNYNCVMAVFDTAKLTAPEALPGSWEELSGSEDAAVLRSFGGILPLNFQYIPGRLSDYTTEELLFSEEDFQDWAVQAYDVIRQMLQGQGDDNIPEPLTAGNTGIPSYADFFSPAVSARQKGKETSLLPLWNADGGVTAIVNRFAAINRNTRQANNAMFLLDALFSPDVLSDEGITSVQEDGNSLHYMMSSGLAGQGIPINNSVCSRKMNPDVLELLDELNEKITAVRIGSSMDRCLLNLGFDLMRCQSELDVRLAASNTYNTLCMMIAE